MLETGPATQTPGLAGQHRGELARPPRAAAHLKRERIVHDLDEAEKHCTICARDLREFGEETSERYEYIPAQPIVIRQQMLPKSEAGLAVAYPLKNWMALTRYCSDGDLPIDNNRTERSLRSFAVGRNNWTFFGSDNGGKTAAVLRSLFLPANSSGSIRLSGFATCLAAFPSIPSSVSKNCCPIVGLKHPANPAPIHFQYQLNMPHPPAGFMGCLLFA